MLMLMTFDMTGEPKYENFLQEQFYPCLIPVLKLTMMLLPMIKMMATTSTTTKTMKMMYMMMMTMMTMMRNTFHFLLVCQRSK